jgi:hypothetical protein
MGVSSPTLEGARRADPTHASGVGIRPVTLCLDDGRARTGFVSQTRCALFLREGDSDGEHGRSST